PLIIFFYSEARQQMTHRDQLSRARRTLCGGWFLALLGLLGASRAEAWEAHLAGTLAGGGDQARAVAVDGDRNVVAVGEVTNFNPAAPLDPLAATTDFTIAKYAGSNGTALWHTFINDAQDRNSEGFAVVVDANNDVYAAGFITVQGSSGRFTVVKLAGATGVEIWRAGFDGNANNADRALSIALDANGNVLAGGFEVNTVTGNDAFVAKLDGATGATLWTRTIDTANLPDSVFNVTSDPAGDVFLAARHGNDVAGVNVPAATRPVAVSRAAHR